MGNKAIFLDRDGTINVDKGYVYRPDDLEIIPDAITGLKEFVSRGFIPIVITNQSGIGRGYYTMADAEASNRTLSGRLDAHGIKIRHYYICPHSPEEKCSCRKPSPEMIFQAAKDYDIDLDSSILLGDKNSDLGTATNAGIRGFLVTNEHTILYWANILLKDGE